MNKQSENIGGGRPKGSPNKATAAVREAIAVFAEGNAHKLQEWLDDVAMGLCEESAKRIIAARGEDWLVFLEGVDYE